MKGKKLTAAALAVLLLFSVMSGIFAEGVNTREVYSGTCGAQGDNLNWTFYTIDGVLSIKGTGNMANWSSPSSVPWYSYAASVRVLLLYSGVTSIGRNAFNGCSLLASVTIPSNVTRISAGAFSGCISLASVAIGGSVTNIADHAFYGCSALASIEIPGSVTSIGVSAFENCSSLASASFLGAPPTSFGSGVFDGCAPGFTIYYPKAYASEWAPNGETTWNGYPIARSDIAQGTCGDNLTWMLDPDTGVLTISGTGEMYDYYYSEYGDDEDVPAPWAEYASEITSVVIEDGVTSIGYYAFAGCTALTAVYIPESVTHIRGCAFYGCRSLLGVELPSGITEIDYDTFAFCYSLEYVTIPEGVTYIGYEAFAECMNLDGVVLPETLETIDNRAFHDCSSLTSLNIPASVTFIGGQAFIGCFSLPGFDVDPDNPVFCSYDGVLFSKDMTELICCPPSKAGDYVVPAGVTTIGTEAFYECHNITSITLPEGLLTISENAFCDCDSLTSIAIPESVSVLGDYAFCSCNGLEYVLFLGGMNFLMSEYVFESCPADMIICYTSEYEDTWNPDGTVTEWWGHPLRCMCTVTYVGVYTGTELVPRGESAELPLCGYAGLHYAFTVDGQPWDGIVDGDVTVTVELEADVYTVLFVDGYTGEVITEMHAYYGQELYFPEAPVHFGCTFLGWDGDISCITGDMTVTAIYEENYCTVTFVGAYSGVQQVLYGADAELPVYDSPTVCYTFTVEGEDWCPEDVTADVTVTVGAATVYSTYHTVTFVGFGGEVLSVQQVRHGLAAQAPEVGDVPGYRFVGWDRDNYTSVLYPMLRTAIYVELQDGIPGDVNGDAEVTFADVSALYSFLIGLGELPIELADNADFDGDGDVTFNDVGSLYGFCLGA